MVVSFRKLRYRMVDERISMAKLMKMAGISDYAARQLGKDKDVSTEVLTKVCAALNCEVQDIVDFMRKRNEKWRDRQVAEKKTNANIGFEKQLWDATCVLWGHIPAAEYRKVIIGLIFLRYISAAFDKRYQELVEEGNGFEDDRDAYTMENVFFVPEEARWSTIASAAHTPEIGTAIDKAMRAIEAENKTLKNVLPKNYASPDLDKRVLGDVVYIFTNNIDMSDTTESEDLLGRTYEYCIAQFAEKEGVGGGEFYTPSSVVKTLVSILRPFDNCRVYESKVQSMIQFSDSPAA